MRNKASVVLFLMMCFFILSYPYRESFWGGLVNAGMLAAVIGGLADWFAVRAIFEKPLGIGFKTAVIVRKRERIFADLIAFVNHDLLGRDNIYKILQRYSLLKLVFLYLDQSNGDKKIKNFINNLVLLMIKDSDKEKLVKIIQSLVAVKIKDCQISKALFDGVLKVTAQGGETELLKNILLELERYIHNPLLKDVLAELVADVKQQYIGDGQMREMASKMLSLSEEDVARRIQKGLGTYLRSLQNQDCVERVNFKEWLEDFLNAQKNNIVVEQALADFLVAMVKDVDIKSIVDWLNETLRNNEGEIREKIDEIVDEKISLLRNDVCLQQKVEGLLQEIIINIINEKHSVLEEKMAEKLNNLSNEELVDLVESRVGEDLQMIRINGSVVGAMVGILLYLITFTVERFV